MQLVYLGNTLINDVMLGSQRMDDVLQKQYSMVSSSLTAFFDGNYGVASGSNLWSASVSPLTASIGRGYYDEASTSFILTGSLSTITYGVNDGLVSASIAGVGDRTMTVYFKPNDGTTESNLVWTGNPGNDRILFMMTTGSANYLKLLTVRAGTTRRQVATSLGGVNINQWNFAAYTANSTGAINNIVFYLNGSKFNLTAAGDWGSETAGNDFWETSTVNGIYPLYGNVAFHSVHNRVLSDAEINEIYNYYKQRIPQ